MTDRDLETVGLDDLLNGLVVAIAVFDLVRVRDTVRDSETVTDLVKGLVVAIADRLTV